MPLQQDISSLQESNQARPHAGTSANTADSSIIVYIFDVFFVCVSRKKRVAAVLLKVRSWFSSLQANRVPGKGRSNAWRPSGNPRGL